MRFNNVQKVASGGIGWHRMEVRTRVRLRVRL